MYTFYQHIQADFSYPVVFGRHVLDPDNRALATILLDRIDTPDPVKTLVFIDDAVADAHPGLVRDVETYLSQLDPDLRLIKPPVLVPGGEAIKNDLNHLFSAVNLMLDEGLCRHSYVMAIGGGAVLDAIGLAASIVHRGLRMVRLPTTVLAQNDAGVGVKNAVNLRHGKNLIGTFSPPFAVINDFELLRSLESEAWRDGIAEAFKVALIKDAEFFEFLAGHADALSNHRTDRMAEHMIMRCAELHLDHIREGGDPFETGTARPLDFGHWAAHELEVVSEYTISHGHAVAMGIRIDAAYAHLSGWLSKEEWTSIQDALSRVGYPSWYSFLDARDDQGRPLILQGLERFREHLGGQLTVTFPQGIGTSHEVHSIDPDRMVEALSLARGTHPQPS